MRAAVFVVTLLAFAAPARADTEVASDRTWTPLRVYLECQGWGRTKACPAFLRGFVDETPLLVSSPRSRAQVFLYYNVTYRANDDHVHLRFTSELDDAPDSYEVTQVVPVRATDDEQRAALRPAFLRGIAVFLAIVNPAAVRVELVVPADAEREAPSTSPWGYSMWTGGNGSLSRQFKSANAWGGFGFSRVNRCSQLNASVSGNYGSTRQPPLVIDGEEVSLDVDYYSVSGRLLAERNLGPRWATGLVLRGGHQDPEGQYRATARAHVGVSHDRFPADDPRGNVLSAAYMLGFQTDWYNAENVLGEQRAYFPTHGLLATGSVRKDKATYRLRASAFAMLLDPGTRYVLDLSPSLSVQLGDHVDVSFSVGITKQAVPGPASVDEESYEEVTRASYAEPLRLWANFNLHVHWDRTNPDRNNRFNLGYQMGLLSTL